MDLAKTMNLMTTVVAAKQLKQFNALGIEMPVADPAFAASCARSERSAANAHGRGC